LKILIAEDHDDIRELLRIELENLDSTIKIEDVNCGELAIDMINSNDFDLIISDYNMPNGNGGEVFTYLKDRKLSIPFLLFSTEDPKDHSEFLGASQFKGILNKVLPSENKLKKIIYNAAGIDVPAVSNKYFKIRVGYFLRFNQTLCDVYIKISDDKFVKLLNKNNYYSLKDIKKYIEKKVNYLFIHEDDYRKYQVKFGDNSFLHLDKRKITTESKEDYYKSADLIIKDLILSLGISEEAIRQASQTIKSTLDIFNNYEKFHDFIENNLSKSSYQYDQCLILSHICHAISDNVFGTSNQVSSSLCAASFFHDIATIEPVNNLTDNSKSLLNLEIVDNELIHSKDHPNLGADILLSVSEFSTLASKVIRNHHEKPDGSGYPRGLTSETIDLASCVFIIASEYIEKLFEVEFDLNKNDKIIIDLQKRFKTGNFKLPLQHLITMSNA